MEEETLFSAGVGRPLADRMRPASLDEIVGQDHLLGPDAPLRRMIGSVDSKHAATSSATSSFKRASSAS